MNKRLLTILACPVCKGGLEYVARHQELHCISDQLAFPVTKKLCLLQYADARRLNDNEPVK